MTTPNYGVSDGNSVVTRPNGVASTGVDSTGAPVTFPFESPPYRTVQITFLQAYVRQMPKEKFVTIGGAMVSPQPETSGCGNGNGYPSGAMVELGVNEAAALVARGMAEYS
jgi:hypothetical protein